MMNQAGSSRLDTVLKMLLIAFISLLAFSSGVYFGKEMSDSDYQLKALEGDFNNAKKTAEKKDLDMKEDEALMDDEVAALSDKYVNQEKNAHADDHGAAKDKDGKEREIASAHGHDKPAAKADGHGHDKPAAKADAHGHEKVAAKADTHAAAKAEAKPDLTEVQKAAQRVAASQPPADAAKPAAKPAAPALPKTVGGSEVEYTVQVASYPTVDTAKSHAEALVKKGFPAYPVEASINGKTWYRVSVGSFKTQKEATDYRAQLLKDADVKTAIVQKIQR